MKILNTITTTIYSSYHNAMTEKQFTLFRPYKLTYKGAARALKNEYPDLETASLNVIRIESAIWQTQG